MPSGAEHITEVALPYFLIRPVRRFRRGEVIYDESRPSKGLHLVREGLVKVIIPSSKTLVDMVGVGEFFGERSYGKAARPECAVALSKVVLMSWTFAEIEEQVQREPRLGIALLQWVAKRGIDYKSRLQSFALDDMRERIAWTLLRFAERFGDRDEYGSIKISHCSHQLISEYVGTTREIINLHMRRFRRESLLRYTRGAISIDADALRSEQTGILRRSQNRPVAPG
jgi:CRP/FNR family transcriptional regulator, cyclic AMP receptor protein